MSGPGWGGFEMVCLVRRGVWSWGVGGVPGLGGVWSWGGGVPGPGGGSASMPCGIPPPLPPVNRMTNRCKNITLATNSLRPVKISILLTLSQERDYEINPFNIIYL